jgi:hypothetical protein
MNPEERARRLVAANAGLFTDAANQEALIAQAIRQAEDEIIARGEDVIEDAKRREYERGLLDAAEYVGGNWDTAGKMADHLREVAAGRKPMYQR